MSERTNQFNNHRRVFGCGTLAEVCFGALSEILHTLAIFPFLRDWWAGNILFPDKRGRSRATYMDP